MKRGILVLAALSVSGCSSQSFDYKTAVKRELRDPNSAEFSDVTVNIESACGFVNSKNGYGGYAGRQPFVVVGKQVTMIEGTSDASALVNARCQEPSRTKINEWLTSAAVDALK